jgi:very-long-chain ceramide synthase
MDTVLLQRHLAPGHSIYQVAPTRDSFANLYQYLYYRSPSFLSLEHLWTDWPERELGGLMKGYTLVQLSFWTQQVYIVQLEERRKDYWQIMAHHAVTIFLIVAAYAYHQTRVGTLILVLMDAIELIFPVSLLILCSYATPR